MSRDLSIYIEAVAARHPGVRQLGIQERVCCCRNSGHSGGDSSADGRLPHDELPHDEADKIIALKRHSTEAKDELKYLERDKIINDEKRSKTRKFRVYLAKQYPTLHVSMALFPSSSPPR